MTQSARDLESTFARAWQLLLHNWIIIVPGIVFGLAGAGLAMLVTAAVVALMTFATGGNASSNYVTDAAVGLSAVIVWMIVAIVQMAFATGMAGAAWERERAVLADGWSAFTHRGVQISLAMIALSLLGIGAASLAPFTLFVSLFAYMVFFIYTMASVIIGGAGPLRAMSESCRLAFKNFLPTVAVVLMIAVIAAAGGWVGAQLGRVSAPLGGAVAGLLQQAIVAYASLVIVGEYAKLRRAAK